MPGDGEGPVKPGGAVTVTPPRPVSPEPHNGTPVPQVTGYRVPLVAPCITDEDREFMVAAIEIGALENEAAVTAFEQLFADRVGCAGAVAVCSGTVALQLALDALGVGTVTIPTYTCVAVRNACGLRRIRYVDSRFDVRQQLLGMERAVTVLPHAFGRRTANPGIPQVEDYTLSLGNVPVLLGRLGVCSTHWSKMITTGRGGVVFGDDLDLLQTIREAACYETHLHPAGSYGMSSTQAVLGCSQLAQLDAFIQRRRDTAAYYTPLFRDALIDTPADDCDSVFFRYLVGVDDPATCVSELARRGIEAGRGVDPLLHRLAGLRDNEYAGACRAHSRLLSVPCHPGMSDGDVEWVAEQVVAVCGR